MRSRATPTRDFRKALCMGGVFAVSTVIPGKIQRLAYPPHNSETVMVHIAGLVLGVVLMLT